MIRIESFNGEIPRLASRALPPNAAQLARNCRFETGALMATRNSTMVASLGANAQTIYHTGADWLSWNALVDVVPGPIASDRLYITGDGVPKVRLPAGTTRNLKLPAPAARPVPRLSVQSERLVIDGKEVILRPGSYAKTASGLDINVALVGATATVTISHATGISAAATQTLINGLTYRITSSAINITSTLRVVRIKSLRDNGGQTYDASRNPIGSDTRGLDNVASKIFVNGTTQDVTIPTPDALDDTNEAGQNDPPVLTTTPLNPAFATGGAAVALFSGTTVSTIEAGQLINRIMLTVEGVVRAVLDPALTQMLAYAYTYVTDLDEESAPSPLSATIGWSPGQVVIVEGFTAPPAGRGVNRIRIYRSQSSSFGTTDLYFVAEIPSATPNSFDIVDDTVLGEVIPTVDFGEPPDALSGIVAMPNGFMAAFEGKNLYFSEPYKPHAWPAKYALQTDYPIIGLAPLGSTAVAVLTTGSPYIAEGAHPENMRMERLRGELPCVNRRTIVAFDYGVAYASSDGIVLIDGAGARIVSHHLWTPYQWKVQLGIANFRCSRLDNYYAISYVDGGQRDVMLIDLAGDPPFLLRYTASPAAFWLRPSDGALFYLAGDNRSIYAFEPGSGNDLQSYEWWSKLYVDPYATNLGAVMIESDGVGTGSLALELWADGALRATVTTSNAIVPLPSGYRAREWQVRVSGQRRVNAITLAHTADEIARAAA